MKEINGWSSLDSEKEVVSGSGLPVGIYPAKIVNVTDVAEKEYLEIKFDICGTWNGTDVDKKQADYFAKNMYEGKWSNQGIIRKSYKESAGKFFRAFITAIEKSNKNYVWNWDEKGLIGKFFVAVFDEEEYLNQDGNIAVSVKCVSERSIEAMKANDIKIPNCKKYKAKTNNDPFANILNSAPVTEADLPF